MKGLVNYIVKIWDVPIQFLVIGLSQISAQHLNLNKTSIKQLWQLRSDL